MKKVIYTGLMLASFISVAQAQEPRVPLFEVFTSSTCGPCNPGNATFDGVVAGKPAGEYVTVKYQMYFPGSGDPYSTLEGKNRFWNIYNAGASSAGIPEMEIDGGWHQNAQSFTNALYTSAKAVPATYKLSGNYTVTGKVVSATIKSKALSAGTDAKLFVAIVETETKDNVKSNGETKFHHVMKKMIPSDLGTPLTAAVGTEETKTLTFTFAGNYRLPANGQTASWINNATEHSVENFANLKVVAWVQGSDKKVYQAANLTKGAGTGVSQVSTTVGAITVYPNPAKDVVNVNFDMTAADEVFATIVSLNGAVVGKQQVKMNAGKNTMTFDVKGLAAGFYNLIIFDSSNNSFAQRVSVVH